MKTLRTAPIALLGLVLALALVGSSCSAANPVALGVGDWQLSASDFEDQMESFAEAYAQATSQAEADQALQGTTSSTWSTSFTASFLNDQMNLELAKLAVADRGLEVTDADRAEARAQLEQNYMGRSGESAFGVLDEGYQQGLVDGIAAQLVLQEAVVASATSEEALRALYEAGGELYDTPQVCASHILVLAGQPDGQTTPSDEDYEAALAEIEEVAASIDGPDGFAAVAATASQDTGSGADGGDLGCAPEGTYVEGFEEAAWSLPIGEVSEPVQSVYGYHLILVRSRGVLSFEDVKDQLAAQVQQDPSLLVKAELAAIAERVDITVDGRYGRFDQDLVQVVPPAGAQQPATSLEDLGSLLGSADATVQ